MVQCEVWIGGFLKRHNYIWRFPWKRCNWILTQMNGCSVLLSRNMWFRVLEIKTKQRLLKYMISRKRSQVQNRWLTKEGILQEVHNSSLCINLHLQITMNQWKTRRWKKTPISMCLKRSKNFTYDHLNTHKHKWMYWMKYHHHTHIKEI